jgi:hypothetical protein
MGCATSTSYYSIEEQEIAKNFILSNDDQRELQRALKKNTIIPKLIFLKIQNQHLVSLILQYLCDASHFCLDDLDVYKFFILHKQVSPFHIGMYLPFVFQDIHHERIKYILSLLYKSDSCQDKVKCFPYGSLFNDQEHVSKSLVDLRTYFASLNGNYFPREFDPHYRPEKSPFSKCCYYCSHHQISTTRTENVRDRDEDARNIIKTYFHRKSSCLHCGNVFQKSSYTTSYNVG